MLQGKWLTAFFGIVIAIVCGGHAFAEQTIKVAYTDPLSGPFAQVGDANLKQMQYIIDYINAKGGAEKNGDYDTRIREVNKRDLVVIIVVC